MATKTKKAKKATVATTLKQLNSAFFITKAGIVLGLVEHSAEEPEGHVVAAMATEISFDAAVHGDFSDAEKKALYSQGAVAMKELVAAGNSDAEAAAAGKSYSYKLMTREEYLEWNEKNDEEWAADRASEDYEIRLGAGEDDDDDYGSIGDDDGLEDGKGEDDFDDGEPVEGEPEDSLPRLDRRLVLEGEEILEIPDDEYSPGADPSIHENIGQH